MLVVFVIYILRGPLRLSENMSHGKHFLILVQITTDSFPTHYASDTTRVILHLNGNTISFECVIDDLIHLRYSFCFVKTPFKQRDNT